MNHRSLANKYRPSSFAELKGQKVLIKTVTNAIRNGKPFPAYLLSGIRGIGKTTSARIIAKTLNCSDLQINEEKVIPCGKCDNCLAVQNDSHPDIIELDAASKTGVNDVREIIDSARYVPILSKYKVYIIDEVHMLSNNAFNALLKILEEPPVNVIFIFATTEFRKIPMTVISRCQKFDLHRFTSQELLDHLKEISDKEGIKYTLNGLKEIAKYSEGSVRDSLSILETISMYQEERAMDEKLVREVLGIPDADCKYKLFEAVLNGNLKASLDIINEIYYKGEDLSKSLEELLSVANLMSKMITIEGYFDNIDLPDAEKSALRSMANKTDLISLTSLWQMIFKGIEDLKNSKNRLQTTEMIMIKICHLSELPSLEAIMSATAPSDSACASFSDVAALFRKNKEMILYHQLMEEVNIISFAPNRLEMEVNASLPGNFANQVKKKLEEWTNQIWQIITDAKSEISSDKTLRVQEKEALQTQDGMVKDILESFPGAMVKTIVAIDNT
jgi:DNA polymerase-3 subunit gamma/tau